MPKVHLTKSVIDELKPSASELVYWDDSVPGFGLKVTPKGRKVFVVLYRTKDGLNRLRKYTIGSYGQTTLAIARIAAQKVLADRNEGKDPARDKRVLRRKVVTDTVEDVVKEYRARHVDTLRSSYEINRIIDTEILSRWKSKSIHEIGRRDILAALDEIMTRGSPATANYTFTVMRAMFNWAILTEKNIKVIRAILMTDVWSRVLALPQSLMAEAQRMLNWSPQKAASLAAVALQVQILTRAPVRVGNLLSIRIGHNLTRAGSNGSSYRLCFPNYDVKNRVDLDFPLDKKTTEIIDQFIDVFRPHLGDGHRGDWLFPGENGKHRSSAHASVSIAKRVEREVGLRVTAHQFRHGAAAMVLKAQPGNYEFARRILGHRNIATTIRFYTALESFKAAEVFGAMMEEQMGNPGRLNLNAKQRVRRKGLTQPTSTMSGRGSKHGNK